MNKSNIITVKNAEGDSDTQAEIIIQNKIDYIPKVSVIIPVYNVEEYLRECLDSVVNQTLKEIEIICIDDGSTDNSLEILKEYAQKDNRITVIMQENLHAGVARNAGLSQAKGEYVHFLDSDDWVELNMLTEMYKKANAHNLDIIVCQCKTLDLLTLEINETKLNYSLRLDLLQKKSIFSVKDIPNCIFQICQGWAWDKLIKRNFINKNCIKFQNILHTNDAQFTFTAMCLANSISYIEKRLITKRHQHTKSLSANRKKDPACFISAIEKIKENLENVSLFNLVKKSFWDWAISLCLIQMKVLDRNSKKILQFSLNKKFNEWKDFDNSPSNSNRYKAIDYIKNNKDFPTINIAYSTNKKFLPLCLASIVSILKNSTFEDINFIILHNDLTKHDLEKIEKLQTIRSFTYCFSHLSDNLFSNFPLVWTTKETWYRCILPDNFQELDKILYLDCDTIIRKSLLPLWNIDLENKFIAAVEDVSLSKDKAKQLNLKDNFFFNAGILLINCKEWRKHNLLKKINQYVSTNDVLWADQGVLNILTDQHKTKISPDFNYMEVWWRENECQYEAKDLLVYKKKDPTIVHFTGIKPNEEKCQNSFKSEFLNYYNLIPYKGDFLNKVPIVLASDNNYALFMYITMVSILENANASYIYDFYLLVPSFFSKENEEKILKLKEKYNCQINFIDMKNHFSDLIMQINHITSPTYYRLLVANLLPKEYEKCIYLDVDICVCQDISKIFNLDIENNYIAGVVAAGYYFEEENNCKRLDLPSMKQYVNAGVLLMNLKQIRQDNMTQKFIDLSKRNYASQDQDVINIACFGKIKTLPPKYNVMTARLFTNDERLKEIYSETEIIEAKNNPIIIHYAAKEKPWNTEVPLGHYWWKYAIKTKLFNRTYHHDLSTWYKYNMNQDLNLANPQTFNEKIQWMKLYDSTPIKTRLADKYLVRDWVKDTIGEKYLIPLLGVYNNFEEIDFNKLPNQFVIKCNHGAAYNIIVKDKSKLNLSDTKAKLDKWMNENFAFKFGIELHYRDIPPKIIIEQYIENNGGDLVDYKFWCFNGKVEYILYCAERNITGLRMEFYDRDWNRRDFMTSPSNTKKIDKPVNLEQMIRFAEILSKDINFVRVDLYRLDDGTIYFGEMTFTPTSGTVKWLDKKYDLKFGQMIRLPNLAYNIDTGEYYEWYPEIETNNDKISNYTTKQTIKTNIQKITNINSKSIHFPLLFKDIGFGCKTWCEPKNITGNDIKSFTYDLSDNIYIRYVSWDPIKEGSCDVEIKRLYAVEKRTKKIVEFPINKIISSGKVSQNRVEFRNQKSCWIGCTIEGAYESFTIEAKIKNI